MLKKKILSVGLRECRGRARSSRHLSRWEEDGSPRPLQEGVKKGRQRSRPELPPSARGPGARSCPGPHRGSGHVCGAPRALGRGGSGGFASWHLCEGDSGWSNSRGRCQDGAWQKSENFLTVTNACLKKCVFIYQWCVQLACVLEKLSRPPDSLPCDLIHLFSEKG